MEMDILASLLAIHMDSQVRIIKMDIEARHHQALGEDWVDQAEAMDKDRSLQWMDSGVASLHLLKIHMPMMALVQRQWDIAGHTLNARIQTTITPRANILHNPGGNSLTILLVLWIQACNTQAEHMPPITPDPTDLLPVDLLGDQDQDQDPVGQVEWLLHLWTTTQALISAQVHNNPTLDLRHPSNSTAPHKV